MKKIPEYIIEEIKQKVSLVETVSQYVTLTYKSGRHWGLCPFHDEKTPSFTVNEDKGFYHCFGCGKSGSVFNFLMDLEHVGFQEAVEQLAEKAGIALKEESEQDKVIRSERDTLIDLYNRLALSFSYILKNSSEAEHARSYLMDRGLSQDTIEKFALGYAPADPNWLYHFLTSRSFSPEFLRKSGIFSRNREEYPLFVDRIMFPIRDYKGNVIAFGGRALSDHQQAKYLNTPETLIFKKRDSLFGLHQSLPTMKSTRSCFVCEGYFDVISLHQSGISNAVAPLGTAFTTGQASTLKRYVEHIDVLFDQDSAGKEAAAKAILLLEQMDLSGSVVELENSKDPSECMVKESPEELVRQVKKSINGFNYLVKKAINTYDITLPEGKLSVFNEVLPYIDTIKSGIKKQSTIRALADAIDINELVLYEELRKTSRVNVQRPERDSMPERFRVSSSMKNKTPDVYLMLTIVNNRSHYLQVRNKISMKDLEDERAIELFTALEECFREGETTIEYLVQRISDVETQRLIYESMTSEEFTIQVENIIEETIRNIKVRALVKKRRMIEQRLKVTKESMLTEVEVKSLLIEKKFIDEEIADIRKS